MQLKNVPGTRTKFVLVPGIKAPFLSQILGISLDPDSEVKVSHSMKFQIPGEVRIGDLKIQAVWDTKEIAPKDGGSFAQTCRIDVLMRDSVFNESFSFSFGYSETDKEKGCWNNTKVLKAILAELIFRKEAGTIPERSQVSEPSSLSGEDSGKEYREPSAGLLALIQTLQKYVHPRISLRQCIKGGYLEFYSEDTGLDSALEGNRSSALYSEQDQPAELWVRDAIRRAGDHRTGETVPQRWEDSFREHYGNLDPRNEAPYAPPRRCAMDAYKNAWENGDTLREPFDGSANREDLQ